MSLKSGLSNGDTLGLKWQIFFYVDLSLRSSAGTGTRSGSKAQA